MSELSDSLTAHFRRKTQTAKLRWHVTVAGPGVCQPVQSAGEICPADSHILSCNGSSNFSTGGKVGTAVGRSELGAQTRSAHLSTVQIPATRSRGLELRFRAVALAVRWRVRCVLSLLLWLLGLLFFVLHVVADSGRSFRVHFHSGLAAVVSSLRLRKNPSATRVPSFEAAGERSEGRRLR